MDLEIIIKICSIIMNHFGKTVITLNIIGLLEQYIKHFKIIDRFWNNTKEEESRVECSNNEIENLIKNLVENQGKSSSNTKVDSDNLQSGSGATNHLENFNFQLEKFNTEKEHNNIFSVIDELTNDLKDYFNKFLDDSNIFDFIINFIYNWNDLLSLSQLSIEQLSALTNLTTAIVILICIFNIISVLFPNYLVTMFQLENKLQKLRYIFKLRRKFNRIYLIFCILMIISLTLVLIYINILILFY